MNDVIREKLEKENLLLKDYYPTVYSVKKAKKALQRI